MNRSLPHLQVVPPGKYVVAVSGGVDSVVLLDLLVQQPELELVVAHFDHGIREDSTEDRFLVATLSQNYGLSYEFTEGKLGSRVSEDQARQARYDYLRQVCKKHEATGVVLAHHQDDAVETLAFNVLRGTHRKGMSSLQSMDGILRPLMGYTKEEIYDYARRNNLKWREDSTNKDEKYTRNWIRRKLLPRLSKKQKRELTESYDKAKVRNQVLDEAVQAQMKEMAKGQGLDRRKFLALPYSVACEIMTAWLRQNGVQDIDRRLIDQLVVSVKTLPPGKKISLGQAFLSIGPNSLDIA
jgi:tRNA(Ile)-lysidine synthase